MLLTTASTACPKSPSYRITAAPLEHILLYDTIEIHLSQELYLRGSRFLRWWYIMLPPVISSTMPLIYTFSKSSICPDMSFL
jgi:hypothetical protein